ncbi:YitT family protein [Blattabacterium punctulatus]|nr:YitT family protein [Blattabacterium punctulatus]AWU39059.1 hypothetical protein DM780_00030 [Blattabacterium punctulatus]
MKYTNFLKNLKYILQIFLGINSVAFGLESFLIPNSFIDGGIMGISLLLNMLTPLKLQFLLIFLNFPFIILGYKHIGHDFAIKTLISMFLLSLILITINFPILTKDKMLASIFGGFFIGSGIGLTIRGGGVLDGTEVFAIYVSRKISYFSVSDIIILINISIFLISSFYLSIESAFYSILSYLVAAKTIDFVIDGIEEYTSVTIITDKSKKIHQMIKKLGFGVTIYNGKSGYNMKKLNIIYTIVTRLEINKLKIEIEKIDSKAFIITQNIKNTQGGMVKKRPFH